jgi:micrococcal nuclease
MCRHQLLIFLFLLSLSALKAEAIGPGVVSGQVIVVHDGDTVTILTADKTQIKVRLKGIDAPELNQAFGQKSRTALTSIIFGKIVEVRVIGVDQYNRALGHIAIGKIDVNITMVRNGMAWHYVKHSKLPALAEAQTKALKARTGLWADKAPVAPWKWRTMGNGR